MEKQSEGRKNPVKVNLVDVDPANLFLWVVALLLIPLLLTGFFYQ